MLLWSLFVLGLTVGKYSLRFDHLICSQLAMHSSCNILQDWSFQLLLIIYQLLYSQLHCLLTLHPSSLVCTEQLPWNAWWHTIATFYTLTNTGVLWPLEGLPHSIRWVSNLMPVTFAVKAVKAVVSKGSYILQLCMYVCIDRQTDRQIDSVYMLCSQLCSYTTICSFFVLYAGMGIDDEEVYEGILITLGWLCLYLFLVILIFRR